MAEAQDEIEVLSGSEEADGPIVTRSATLRAREAPPVAIESAVDEFVTSVMSDVMNQPDPEEDEEDEDLVRLLSVYCSELRHS